MLNILYGRAGTGKTTQIMNEIKDRASTGETGMLLIVPEQYSHDAERHLCEICGDSMSLHAEVLSFTRLCGHVLAETGGAMSGIIDKGSQMLLLYKALEASTQYLKVFGVRKTRANLLESLLASIMEFRSMRMTARQLEELADKTSTPLSDKLRDFALTLGAYDSLLEQHGSDSAQRLELLASKIRECSGREDCSSIFKVHIYFDGFNDFTALEMQVIKEMLGAGADITVCLTCEVDKDLMTPGYEEVFELPRRTIAQLRHLEPDATLERVGVENLRETCPELAFLEQHLFDDEKSPKFKSQLATHGKSRSPALHSETPHSTLTTTPNSSLLTPNFTPDENNSQLISHPITIFAAPSRYEECMYAAAVICRMVRVHGCRWSDIGVMARDFAQYEPMCEQVFEKYGIPYFSGGKADILNKPPAALIDAALEIATMGFEYKPVFRYLKTGLLQISVDELAMLENYIIMWNIRGNLWMREWKMPPSGYATGHKSDSEKERDRKTLAELNRIRKQITSPLIALRDGIKGETRTEDKLRALYEFTIRISLPEKLVDKSNEFSQSGQLRLADEYTQLLDIIIDALDRMYTITGESEITAQDFRKLTSIVLSQSDVGVIPISLDRVPIGSMSMSRRRDLKCLIILGASDENMPNLSPGGGALSDNERKILAQIDSSIPSGFEERLYREMNMIYSTLTLPSENLVMIYDNSGNVKPSMFLERMCNMFEITQQTLSETQYLSLAEKPYQEYLELNKPVITTANRGQLNAETAKLLYGNDLTLSASRVDSYYSCRYRHFLQRGLRLSTRRAAQFDAASAGTYMHSILDGVLRDIAQNDGFENVTDNEIKSLVDKHSQRFVDDVLLGFEGKNERFVTLFRRYEKSVLYVAHDLVDELRASKFKPVEFEMDLSKLSDTQRGFIDRVDAYESGGKLYLRVIDYKTRRNAYKFNLSDVLNGRDMQMLIYLSTLIKHKDAQPAGVLYVPARDVIVPASRDTDDSELGKLRRREMKRSGLVLNDDAIIEAMESGIDKRFLPVKILKDGTRSGDSIASSYCINKLLSHVENKMSEARKGILNGENECKPYYKNANDNACAYCDYPAVCRFDRQMGDKYNFAEKMSADDVWEVLEAEKDT